MCAFQIEQYVESRKTLSFRVGHKRDHNIQIKRLGWNEEWLRWRWTMHHWLEFQRALIRGQTGRKSWRADFKIRDSILLL